MNTAENKMNSVLTVTGEILCELDALRDTGSGKALLANLRASVGKTPSRMSAVWPIFFAHLPEIYLSRDGNPTKQELAILHALQYYALYQQGCSHSVLAKYEHNYQSNFGTSLADLRVGNEVEAIDRCFRILLCADDFAIFAYRARQLLLVLKGRTKGKTIVDFSRLASDFYRFLQGYQEEVRFQWAETYYQRKIEHKGEENA